MVLRYLTWLLPCTLAVPPVTGTPRASGACLPPEGCDQHAHLCGYGMAASCRSPVAEQSGLIYRIPCLQLRPARPRLQLCCSASFAWRCPALPARDLRASRQPSLTSAVPESPSSSQLLPFSHSSPSQDSTHCADRRAANHPCIPAAQQCSAAQVKG